MILQAVGGTLSAIGFGRPTGAILDDPGYWDRATDLRALALAPSFGAGRAAAEVARPGRWKWRSGTAGFGTGLGTELTVGNAISDVLPDDRGRQATNSMAERWGLDTTHQPTMQRFRDQMELEGGAGPVIRNFGFYRGIQNPNSVQGQQPFPFDTTGMQMADGSQPGGSFEIAPDALAHAAARGIGVQVPQAPVPAQPSVPSQQGNMSPPVYNNNVQQRFVMVHPQTGQEVSLWPHQMQNVHQSADGSYVFRTTGFNGRPVELPLQVR